MSAEEAKVVSTESVPVEKEDKSSASTAPATLPQIEGKSEEEIKSLVEKVSKQVHFYFSDSNLPIDKYFFSLTACNPEGWVPIKTIMTFKRMRDFQPLGVEFAAQALRFSAAEEGDDPLIEVSSDGENVRRRRPLEPNATAWSRSVYVKGFPEGESADCSQEKLEEYFEPFGKINAVRQRRGDIEDQGPKGKGKGKFKGSVFVEFAYEADMQKFLDLEEIPKFTEGGEDMVRMTKEAYVQMKAKEKGIPTHTISRGSTSGDKGGDHKPSRNQAGVKFNAFREMDKLKKGGVPQLARIGDDVAVVGKPPQFDASASKGNKRARDGDDGGDREAKKPAVEQPFFIEYKGVKLEVDREGQKIKDPSKLEFEMDTVVKFVGAGEDADWKALKVQIAENGIEKPFLAYPPKSQGGSVAKSDSTLITDSELAALNDAKILFGGVQTVWSRPSEEEQRAFWTTRANFQAKTALEAEQSKAGTGGGGGGGGGDRKGGRDAGSDKPASGPSSLPPTVVKT